MKKENKSVIEALPKAMCKNKRSEVSTILPKAMCKNKNKVFVSGIVNSILNL